MTAATLIAAAPPIDLEAAAARAWSGLQMGLHAAAFAVSLVAIVGGFGLLQ